MAILINLRQARKAAARVAKRNEVAAAMEAARHAAQDKVGVAAAKAEAARLDGKRREDE